MPGLIEAELSALNSPFKLVLLDLLTDLGFAVWEEETPDGERLKVVYSKEERKSLTKALKHLRKSIGLEVKLLAEKEFDDEYCFKQWSKHLKPLLIGEKLEIIPLKENFSEPDFSKGERIKVFIKPGLAFGTGSHPSTSLCLELLEKYLKPGAKVLDVGTGSGILIIAARKLGAGKSVAIDNDRYALENAVYNSKLNQAGEIIFYQLSISQWKNFDFDLVLANLTAEEIIKNSLIWKKFRPTLFICSGILKSEAGKVETSLSRLGFIKLEKKEKEGWVALACKIN